MVERTIVALCFSLFDAPERKHVLKSLTGLRVSENKTDFILRIILFSGNVVRLFQLYCVPFNFLIEGNSVLSLVLPLNFDNAYSTFQEVPIPSVEFATSCIIT